MLIREEGTELHLASAVPRAWMTDGRAIQVEHAATYFGEMGYRLESQAGHGRITAELDLPQRNPPQSVTLRLRHPEGKTISRVELNGKSWQDFEPARERVRLPPQAGHVTLRAIYDG